MERTMPGVSGVKGSEFDMGRDLSISVIMPVYNAAHFLPLSLAPLIDMLKRGEVIEVIAVDDGASDNSAQVAADLGARVIPSGGRLGPGGARNVAAAQAKGDIIWFVDSDVVVHPGGPERIRAALTQPGVVAMFGSYDDRPAAPNFGSQYKNLLHHHHHTYGRPEASTFWAGCGAVLRKTFLEVGGYDARRYPYPSIEDIELGYRFGDAGGKIRLDPGFRSKHLKRWTIPELIRVDILRRAIPWSRLLFSRPAATDDLNVTWVERLRAVLAALFVLALLATLVGLVPLWTPLAAVAVVIVSNWRLFRTFQGGRGTLFAIAAMVFHQLYYLYSAAIYVGCWIEAKLAGKREPVPGPDPILAR